MNPFRLEQITIYCTKLDNVPICNGLSKGQRSIWILNFFCEYNTQCDGSPLEEESSTYYK